MLPEDEEVEPLLEVVDVEPEELLEEVVVEDVLGVQAGVPAQIEVFVAQHPFTQQLIPHWLNEQPPPPPVVDDVEVLEVVEPEELELDDELVVEPEELDVLEVDPLLEDVLDVEPDELDDEVEPLLEDVLEVDPLDDELLVVLPEDEEDEDVVVVQRLLIEQV